VKDYDPEMPLLREMLALSIIGKLEECGFELMSKPKDVYSLSRPELSERVYFRTIENDSRMQVRVYTTVIGGENNVPLAVRSTGKDAIRVCAIYSARDGKHRGLSKETRINRTGNIDDIVDRMYQRMRSAYKTGTSGQRCTKCGAPKFITKNNKQACAEICWLSDEEKRASDITYKTRNRRLHRRRW
jgi:hypothetical protein